MSCDQSYLNMYRCTICSRLSHFKLFLAFILPESVESHQRSFDLGIQLGHQRRNKVISFFPFLCPQNCHFVYGIVNMNLVQLSKSWYGIHADF